MYGQSCTSYIRFFSPGESKGDGECRVIFGLGSFRRVGLLELGTKLGTLALMFALPRHRVSRVYS